MEYRQLGQTDLKVSVICLGTMTWGEQNTEAEAHAQMDLAWERGVNFMDAAEMYPVPPKAETAGCTEAYIGTWLSSRKNRDKVILATKVAGPSGMDWIRGGSNLDRKNIEAAIESSLKRLQTDYVDLYQLHWPARYNNRFGQLGFDWPGDESSVPLEETLAVLADVVKSGKVRYVGLSNETPWGAMKALHLAENNPTLPRMQSVQNPYSLLNRSYEVGMAELSIREQCGLLAYSPLAFGRLTDKYSDGTLKSGTRLTDYTHFMRYESPESRKAAKAYVALAKQYGLSAAQMALAYVNSRPFVTSNIIGATTLAQLEENIASAEVTLSHEVLAGIEAIHTSQPNPAP